MASKLIAPQGVVHKMHLVTRVRSVKSRPWWEKRMIKTLGLERIGTQVILKNTPEINEMLRTIKSIITMQPLLVDGEHEASATIALHPAIEGVSEAGFAATADSPPPAEDSASSAAVAVNDSPSAVVVNDAGAQLYANVYGTPTSLPSLNGPLINPITGVFNKQAYDRLVAAFPEKLLDDAIRKDDDPLMVNANRNWQYERDCAITDKGKKLTKYLEKATRRKGQPKINKLRERDMQYGINFNQQV